MAKRISGKNALANQGNASVLKWARVEYTPTLMKITSGEDEREVRAEYARLRRIAQNRLRRLEQTGNVETDLYNRFKKGFPVLSDIKTKRQLVYNLSDLATFIESPYSTPRGIEAVTKKTVESLNARGYTFVNSSNLKLFGEFMELARSTYRLRMVASDRVAVLVDKFLGLQKEGAHPDAVEKRFKRYLQRRTQHWGRKSNTPK